MPWRRDVSPFDIGRLEPCFRLEYRDAEAVVLALPHRPPDLATGGVAGGPLR